MLRLKALATEVSPCMMEAKSKMDTGVFANVFFTISFGRQTLPARKQFRKDATFLELAVWYWPCFSHNYWWFAAFFATKEATAGTANHGGHNVISEFFEQFISKQNP